MALKKRNRWLTNGPLLCLLLIPALFWYFSARMAIYRYEARQVAEKIYAAVTDQQEIRYTCEDSDGRSSTCTHWTYKVTFNLDGQQLDRQLLDARFDPTYIHHTDGIDHDAYPVGSEMPVLLRRDLDNAVAPDFFWSAYLMPVFLFGFGLFTCPFMGIAIGLGWQKAPYRHRTVTRN